MTKKPKKTVKPAKPQLERFTLSERIKYLRQKRDLTQSQLAKLAQISQSTVAQIENGDKDPSFTTLLKLSGALDCHIAVFFTSEDLHVFDMKRLRKKYNSVDKLNPTLYYSFGRVIDFAREIGFLK